VRTNTTMILAWIAILALAVGCRDTERKAADPDAAARTPGASTQRTANAAKPSVKQGKVVETMNSGGYTYVKVAAGGGQDWYAGPETPVTVGETVVLPTNAMVMNNFTSNSLDRTFERIYFVGTIGKPGGAKAASTATKPRVAPPEAAPDTDFTGIEKAEGGMTVAEIFQAGASAAGREVVLRGKVVKYSPGIMGKNWVHVRDGTGEAGSNDITITTKDSAKVGDTVLVTGKLAADRDFGHGYKYALLIEDAKVVVE